MLIQDRCLFDIMASGAKIERYQKIDRKILKDIKRYIERF